MEVTLAQMLEAREARAFRQFQLNREWKLPIISFSMNIPGPVKYSPLIAGGFRQGCQVLEERLPEGLIRHQEKTETVTGCEALYVVDMAPEAVKAITTQIEDTHPLGRLFDMDVLDGSLSKLDREAFGGGDRSCVVCGAPGRGCASRRAHSVEQLQRAVQKILLSHFVAETAVRSLLEEVHTTPKPGLVDERNTGSHKDMDLHTFTVSAHALAPYFHACVTAGMDSAHLPPAETFAVLRKAGVQAEKDMLAATSGVNTHKGAIFTMGTLCGAAGRLWKPEGGWREADILREASAMTRDAMERDILSMAGNTSGERLYASLGIRGIRGEVSDGLPSVSNTALPVYRRYLKEGRSRNDAGALTLLHLIAQVEDTCLIHRGGPEGAREAVQKVNQLLRTGPSISQMEALDDWFIQRNLSPGGCADLLAAAYFMDSLCKENEVGLL